MSLALVKRFVDRLNVESRNRYTSRAFGRDRLGAARDALERVNMVGAIKAQVPVRTGKLRDSVRIITGDQAWRRGIRVVRGDGRVSAASQERIYVGYIESPPYYGHLIEFGDSVLSSETRFRFGRRKANPIIRTTFKRLFPRFSDAFIESLEKRLGTFRRVI